MSKYTTEVRYICESYAERQESGGYGTVEQTIESARDKIFDFDYPIFDESYRSVLETKILKHYYTREIGLETVGLWKLKLNTLMNEIMPYYNQMYRSTTLEFNPLYDFNFTTTKNGTVGIAGTDNRQIESYGNGTTTTSASSSNSDTGWSLVSDTPQGSIGSLDDGTYLTQATKNTDTSNGSTNGSVTEQNSTNKGDVLTRDMKTTEEYVVSVSGKKGGMSYAKMIMEYRQSMINVDMMIIENLEQLFLQIW